MVVPLFQEFSAEKKSTSCHSDTSHFINKETCIFQNFHFGKKPRHSFSETAFGNLLCLYSNDLPSDCALGKGEALPCVLKSIPNYLELGLDKS